MSSDEFRPKRSLDAIVRTFRGTLYVGIDEEFVELTDVAGTVWKLLDGTRTLEDLTNAVVEEYDTTPDVARADIEELLGEMEEARLIEPRAGA